MTTLSHSSSSSSPLCSRLFAKDDEGEGAVGTGTSHVVVMAPVVVCDHIVSGDFIGLDDADNICPSHGRPPHQKTSHCIPAFLQTTWPASPCSCCIIMHWRRWGRATKVAAAAGEVSSFISSWMNSGVGEARGRQDGSFKNSDVEL